MTIQETEQQIIDEFADFDEWLDRYAYLIELGKDCPQIDEHDKTPQNIIKGCQSNVWLSCEMRDGCLYFRADSDAVITRGIISLLIRAFDGHTPDDILGAEITFIDAIGLREHLSPTRSNGLTAMLKQIKMYALAYKMKGSQQAQRSQIEK